jgi:hypothetical protein
VRWWLYRVGTLVAVVFIGAAIMYPYQPCPHLNATIGPRTYPPALLEALASCGRWHVALRVQMALTGILLALVIAFIGARIDRLIGRSRGLKGAALLPSP